MINDKIISMFTERLDSLKRDCEEINSHSDTAKPFLLRGLGVSLKAMAKDIDTLLDYN